MEQEASSVMRVSSDGLRVSGEGVSDGELEESDAPTDSSNLQLSESAHHRLNRVALERLVEAEQQLAADEQERRRILNELSPPKPAVSESEGCCSEALVEQLPGSKELQVQSPEDDGNFVVQTVYPERQGGETRVCAAIDACVCAAMAECMWLLQCED